MTFARYKSQIQIYENPKTPWNFLSLRLIFIFGSRSRFSEENETGR